VSYRSALYFILALDASGWQTSRPGRLTPRKGIPYAFYRELCGPQVGAKNLSPTWLVALPLIQQRQPQSGMLFIVGDHG